ncbi:hypothetical protein [Sporocytophaga myxococcoides]|nr:hypothetical protein [Sporocytophaga myxococcoides]
MKKLIIILGLTIFNLTSCIETKEEAKEEQTVMTVQPAEQPTTPQSDFNANEQIVIQKSDLYYFRDLESNIGLKVGFISLSDIYPLSEHADSLAIPNFEDVNKNNLQYFKLSSEYRNRFLSKTKISKDDSVFIYDYSNDVLFSFPVKKLNVVAYLSVYVDKSDCPCSQYDYMIGFEINKDSLTGFDKYLNYSLAYVGKENPFILGQMRPISWERIDIKEFPVQKSNIANNVFRQLDLKKGNAYLYNSELYRYYIQEYMEISTGSYLAHRLLIVLDRKGENLIMERAFSESEGTSMVPLNFGIEHSNNDDLKEQWTGYLFKDKPQVVFGFESHSFGCPNIIFLDSKERDLYINCDNRH